MLDVLEACHRLALIEGQKENEEVRENGRKIEKNSMGESKQNVFGY